MTLPGKPGAAAALRDIRFAEPALAREDVRRISTRVPESLLGNLKTLLADVPDPDSALSLFQRLTETEYDELLHLLEREPVLIHYALLVFAHSQYLGDALIRNPDMFAILVRDKGLAHVHSVEHYHEYFARLRSRSFDTDLSALLARFKKREYIRVMLRDVLGLATIAETTAEISALSDVLIEEAVRDIQSRMRNRYGPAQHLDDAARVVDTQFSVLSLGKLGGNELNYNSDIDLLFLFDDGASVPDAALSNREYCIRLAQEITAVLTSLSPEGPVFRIDLRLRPQGREGEPAISLQQAVRYYTETARDWELQALIKVRHSAGDRALSRQFIRAMQPLVYRGEQNFSAIETALIARRKQREKHRPSSVSKQRTLDVKTDAGGIREIEFLVQCLQRVYGGRERWLRSGGTLFSLQKLHDKGHLSGNEFHLLTSTYEFLRRVEHRLQLEHGQQRHHLPSDAHELERLARSVEPHRLVSHVDFVEEIRSRMRAVSEVYQRIIHQQRSSADSSASFSLTPVEAISAETPASRVLARLRGECPEAYEVASDPALDPVARKNLLRFLNSAFTSSQRYATLLENASALRHAVEIFNCSELLSDILVRYPEELSALRHNSARLGLERPLLSVSSEPSEDAVFDYAATVSSLEETMSLLRRHYRHRVFMAGVQSIASSAAVSESLADLTAAAESAIRTALHASGAPPGLSVWALGRLGSREFDVLSDADLLFLCGDSDDVTACTRAAEKIIHLLSAYTPDGSVFPVDTRLRPHGTEGELVVSARRVRHYLSSEAQPWEALTYTKLRHIAGARDPHVADYWNCLFDRFAAAPDFPAQVRAMRERLESSARDDLKVAPGGLYDLDFIIAFLAIRNLIVLAPDTMRHRLQQLGDRGALSPDDVAALDSAAEFLRATEHAIRLVTGTTQKSLPNSTRGREAVRTLLSRSLSRNFPDGTEKELQATLGQVREIYTRILAAQ